MQDDRAFIASTFFAKKVYLDGYTYNFQKLRRWFGEGRMRGAGAGKRSLLEYELLVVPVNWRQQHWAVAVANMKQNYVAFYDSLQVSHVWSLLDELYFDRMGSEDRQRPITQCRIEVHVWLNCRRASPLNSDRRKYDLPFSSEEGE